MECNILLLGRYRSTCHDLKCRIVVPEDKQFKIEKSVSVSRAIMGAVTTRETLIGEGNLLVADLHLCILAPNISQIVDSLVVDLGCLLEDSPSRDQVVAILVKLGKVDPKAVELS